MAALAQRLFRQAYGGSHPEPQLSAYLAREFAAAQVAGELEQADVAVWVAQDARGEPVGYLWLQETAAPPGARVPGERSLQLRRIFVDSSWHGRGVAQALMDAGLGEAERRGADAVWLAVWQEAARPLAFYRRSGFEVVGTATFAVEDHLDQDFIMARRLRF